MNNEIKYKYAYIEYLDMLNDRMYCYLTDNDSLKKGDIVEVERGEEEVLGRVVNIIEYTEDNAPYPLEDMKYIYKIVKREK